MGLCHSGWPLTVCPVGWHPALRSFLKSSEYFIVSACLDTKLMLNFLLAKFSVGFCTKNAALGHGGNSVTDIYIDFDRRKVDEANRRVLDWVLYGRR